MVVVIAILAAITIVAFNGVQARARDSARKNDIAAIKKALELYYIDNGSYPPTTCASGCKINNYWSSTSDGSWSNLAASLVPKYISKLPSDPQASSATNPAIAGGFNYDLYTTTATNGTTWCSSAASGQLYLLAYRYENQPQEQIISGNCPGAQPTSYASSQFVSTK